jgi:hypothetical protein
LKNRKDKVRDRRIIGETDFKLTDCGKNDWIKVAYYGVQ